MSLHGLVHLTSAPPLPARARPGGGRRCPPRRRCRLGLGQRAVGKPPPDTLPVSPHEQPPVVLAIASPTTHTAEEEALLDVAMFAEDRSPRPFTQSLSLPLSGRRRRGRFAGVTPRERLDSLLGDLRLRERPVRIVKKGRVAHQRAAGAILRVLTLGGQRTYLTHYVTTLGHTIYVPDDFDGWDAGDAWRILRHELVHVAQFERYGWPLMIFVYGFFPLPAGLAYGRARLEWEAYAETLRAKPPRSAASRRRATRPSTIGSRGASPGRTTGGCGPSRGPCGAGSPTRSRGSRLLRSSSHGCSATRLE